MTLEACLLVGHPSFLGNRVFSEDPAVMRDNCNDMYVRLRRKLFERGIELNTEDITPDRTARLIFQLDVPRHELTVQPGQVAYLILGEPATVLTRNWDRRGHRPYRRVLTWSDDLADGHKYLLVRNGYDLTVEFGDRAFRDRRFCTMIASARRSSHNLSLYAERDALVRWMSQHRANEFDLYGRQWPSSLRRVLPPQLEHRLPALARRCLDAFYPPVRVYRGPVFSKREVLQRYRFSICYENMRDTPGYITEKIFDAMCAGCVPVYWGASNIADLVPLDCFIDRRRFRDTEALVAYLDGITAEDFGCFQSRIRDFLSSPAAAPFRGTSFAEAVTGVVVEDLGLPC